MGWSLSRLCGRSPRGLAFAAACGLALAVLAIGCGKKSGDASGSNASGGASTANAAPATNGASPAATDQVSASADSAATRAKKPISLDVAPVIRGELVHAVSAEGILRARRQTEIKAELNGTLDRLLVDDGRAVSAGQLIAVLDQREYRAALAEARARHLKALSELAVNLELNLAGEVNDSALTAYQRDLETVQRDLDSDRITSDQYREQSLDLELRALQGGAFRREVLEARTGFAEARAAEERAQLNLELTEIRAPFAGNITDLVAVAGERIQIGQVLCQLINTTDLEAEVHVLESDLGTLASGRPALLTIPAVEQTLPVRVSVVSPHVDTDSRTCRVLLRFTNDSPLIRPGMFVRAQIATEMLPDRLLVPKEAVLEREKRPLVFKVSGDQALWVYVETGGRNDTYVEITGVAPGASLAAGDQVVVSDHLTLAHEALIKVRDVVNPPDPWRDYFPSAAATTTE